MTTAVHGKASLADMLLGDGAASAKSSDEDRDKIDTVDFGATLTSLIDPAAAGNSSADTTGASSPSSISQTRSKQTVDATSPFASDSEDAPASFDTRTMSSNDFPTTASEHYQSELPQPPAGSIDLLAATPPAAHATAEKLSGRTFSERIAALFASNSTDAVEAPPVDDPATPSIENHSSGGRRDQVTNATDARRALAATDTSDAGASTAGEHSLVAGAEAPVPDQDIALEFRKQLFPLAAKDESPTPQAIEFSNPPTVADVEQIALTASGHDSTTPHPTGSAHASAPHSQNGTSPALSSRSSSANQDSMQTSDPTLTQATLAKVATNASAMSEQQVTSQQFVSVAQGAPQQQRIRTDGLKDTSPQVKTAPTLEADSTSNAASQPTAHAPEAAAIHQVTEVAPTQASRSVSITVQLTEGQTAQANVREHAGAVEVKIVTPNASSAQRVSSEIDGMRQNLNAAGIKLGHSEVSYQGGDGGRQGREQYRPASQNQSTNEQEVFVMDEVNQ